jgi:hypothetical protein
LIDLYEGRQRRGFPANHHGRGYGGSHGLGTVAVKNDEHAWIARVGWSLKNYIPISVWIFRGYGSALTELKQLFTEHAAAFAGPG